MSLIRSDLSVSPSFSRSGKTVASVNAQAMGQLKKELELATRKAVRRKVTDTLNSSHKEILAKVLDHSITGVPPSYGTDQVSREQDMASSPREPSTWKLSSSPTKDSSVKLPRSIDWDLLAEEEADAEMFAGASPSQDHVRNALQTPNLGVLDELGRKLDTRPSAAFMTPGRDSALSERSTQAPESGRYNPKLHATQRRSPAITILDRSLLRKKVEYDEKKFIIADKLKSHQAAPSIERTTGRDKPVVGRIICKVGAAEQRACFGVKGDGQEDVMYDTSVYWEHGGGSRKVPLVPEFAKTPARSNPLSPKKMMLYCQPRIYSRSYHITWTEKASGMKTVANLGDTAMLGRQLQRKEPKRAWETRQDYRDNGDKVSSQGEFFDLAIKKPTANFEKTLPRDKDQSVIRNNKLDKGGPDMDYDMDRAWGLPAYHVVPFSKLMPRRPASEMTAFGKESPDVIYHPEKSWKKFCSKNSVSPVNFQRTVGRGQFSDNLPESMLLMYPNADKIKKHMPTVQISKSIGHRPLITKMPSAADNDLDYTSRIMSQTGRAATSLGFAWHPSECDAKSLHIPTPDIAAGGKGRPNVAKKLLDKVYETAPCWKVLDKRVPVPNLGQGAAGQGKASAEFKAERQRLEGEIKTIISGVPTN